MTRGNQRDARRDKVNAQKAKSKNSNTMSGSEFQRAKEDSAAIMRRKQEEANARKAAEGAAGGKKK